MNKIKKKNTHNLQVELDELRKVAVLIVEQDDLLEQLEASSIEDFETKINALSKFTNPMASANAFGKEAEYKRLLELEGLVDGRLTSGDLTKSKDLKSAVIASIIEKHTIYFSESELALKTVLEKLMETFNNLNPESRKHVGFTFQNELKYTPYSSLK